MRGILIKGIVLGGSCGLLLPVYAQPSLNGQSGYINMPSADVGRDGSLSFGFSSDKPYNTLWVSATALPFLQISGRYISISGIAGFDDPLYGGGYGSYKDKAIDTKWRLLDESGVWPALAFGRTDIFGTALWRGNYLVASKHLSPNLEVSAGVGSGRIEGPFGGLRWTPERFPRWSLIAEYDANHYSSDIRAKETFAAQRKKGPAAGIEYRWGWLGLQLAKQKTHASLNASIEIPLNEREFVPKINEPAYFNGGPDVPLRPTLRQWHADSAYGHGLVSALSKQDFKNIRISMRGDEFVLELNNSRISNVGRAVGRAVRTALYFAPIETRSIRVVYTKLEQPIATYSFFNLATLNDYLLGKVDRQRFLDSVNIKPGKDSELEEVYAQQLSANIKDSVNLEVLAGKDGDIVQLNAEDNEANRFRLVPKTGVYFNDPSGAFRYEIAAAATYTRRLGTGLFLNSALSANLYNTVSGVKQPSNSLLPHVRSDVAEYKKTNSPKLDRLLLNQYLTLGPNTYARASAGIYEEMFRGAGGQVLYYPDTRHWAIDLAVDALQQRDYKGWLGKRDYQTVTALASLHYKLPLNVTATVRAGRFLAKDSGARLELKRRFRSGIEIGAWYTSTNGNDISSPGTPSSPYKDKGLFISIPLNSMLTLDTQAVGNFALSPWTRDVGQMVMSPGDLYDQLNDPRSDVNAYDGLGNFAERPDEQGLPQVNPPPPSFHPWPSVRLRLDDSSRQFASMEDKPGAVAIAAGMTLAAIALDKPVNQAVGQHQDNRLLKGWKQVGNALPIAALGLAGGAFALGDDRLSNTGLIALESSALSAAGSIALKGLGNRARPNASNNPWQQQPAGSSRFQSSFTSNHAAVLFGALTPFAKEYDQPWLYGLAAIGALGRVAGKDHWLSDVAAGSLLGYASGSWLWQAQRDESRYRTSLMLGPKQAGIQVSKSLD
ncbi:YjbH domain-containing protein [Chromobacterium haemolyticum]|uniref:YjbH domain-containing protein n=1 Tax=Chromobacterium haemolyticum TaxID=394935 RepID=UPI0005946606|nr:YjbH domain-containing protein [Chromobacterium haemolyticum]